MAKPTKMVNGVSANLTGQEIAERAQEEAAWAQEQAAKQAAENATSTQAETDIAALVAALGIPRDRLKAALERL